VEKSIVVTVLGFTGRTKIKKEPSLTRWEGKFPSRLGKGMLRREVSEERLERTRKGNKGRGNSGMRRLIMAGAINSHERKLETDESGGL